MKALSLLICLLFSGILQAQEVKITFRQQLPDSHPRYLTNSNGKSETLNLIEKEDWAKDVFEKLKRRSLCQPDRCPTGLVTFTPCHVLEVSCYGCIYKR